MEEIVEQSSCSFCQDNQQKIENLKNLLGRAKISMDKYKQEIQQKSDQIENLIKQNQELDSLVKKLLTHDTQQQKQIIKVQGRLEIDSVNWMCVKLQNATEWIREDEYMDKHQQDSLELPPLMIYEKVFQNELKIKELQTTYQKDMENIIKQYEDRVNRMSKNIEEQDLKIQQLKEKTKNQLDMITSKIIDESQQIRENCLFFVSEETDENTKQESLSKIKFLLIKMEQLNFNNEYSSLNEIKNNILILHQTLFDTLKSFHQQKQENSQQEKKWRIICNKIDHEKQREEKEKIEISEALSKKIYDLNVIMDKQKGEFMLQMKEKEVKIEFLQKEVKKNINVQYIKNILIKFLISNDKNFREKTLPVIATVLQFTQPELENVRDHLFTENQNSLGKFFGFGLNQKK